MKKMLLLFCLVSVTSLINAQQIRKVKIDELVKYMDTATVPLVVNFWATWCKPCIHEIPWFEKGVAAVKDKNVRLLLVSVDLPGDYPKYIANFAKDKGYTSTILWLDETNADVFCPKIDKSWNGNIPVTVMVNNAKKYRQFYSEQIPEARFTQELQKLVE